MLLFAFDLTQVHQMKLEYSAGNSLKVTKHTAIGTDLLTWLKVLSKSEFDVQWAFLPKALFITAIAAVNYPFHLFERLRFSNRINQVKVERPLFVLGHPRSGTTFLQYLLSQDPRFAYPSTFDGLVPNLFLTGGKTLQRLMQLGMPDTRPQDNVRISAALPVEEEFAMASISETSWVHGLYFPKTLFRVLEEEVIFSGKASVRQHWKDHFLFFLKKIAFKYPDKTLLLKSPANTGRLKEIHELFPDARFIHIHRDPYEVYQSMEGLYEKILPVLSFHRVQESTIEEYIFYFYEKIYKKYLHDKSLIPASQIVDISYRDLVTQPVKTLQGAYQHLSLGDFDSAAPFIEREVRDTKDYQKNSYSNLDPKIIRRINEQWRFAFEAFGYTLK